MIKTNFGNSKTNFGNDINTKFELLRKANFGLSKNEHCLETKTNLVLRKTNIEDGTAVLIVSLFIHTYHHS